MIFSKELMFSDDQDVSQAAGTYNSTNAIDTGAPGTVYGAAAALARNVGPGNPVPILVQLTETVTSGGAATMQFQIETADEEAFDTTNVVVAQSRVYALADLVAGLQFGVAVLPNDMKRFIRVNYVIGTATTTAGLAKAGIVHGVQTA
ncbi:MAG: Bbp16 family capsid cement protein [Thalassospira sp.]|uniref:Bbp16 family capsid cement protein n=1 Tax=Thalassospira sp. TaxID=1912094 RepID=UPI003A8789C8